MVGTSSKVVSWAILFVCLALTDAVAADDRPATEVSEELSVVPHPGPNGEVGLWFPLADAKLALQARATATGLARQVRLLDRSLSLAEQEIRFFQRSSSLHTQIQQQLEASLSGALSASREAQRSRQVAEDALSAWWRHPVFWAGVGLVIGAVGVAILAASL